MDRRSSTRLAEKKEKRVDGRFVNLDEEGHASTDDLLVERPHKRLRPTKGTAVAKKAGSRQPAVARKSALKSTGKGKKKEEVPASHAENSENALVDQPSTTDGKGLEALNKVMEHHDASNLAQEHFSDEDKDAEYELVTGDESEPKQPALYGAFTPADIVAATEPVTNNPYVMVSTGTMTQSLTNMSVAPRQETGGMTARLHPASTSSAFEAAFHPEAAFHSEAAFHHAAALHHAAAFYHAAAFHPAAAPSPFIPPPPVPRYTCQWAGCIYYFNDSEDLYLHLCEDHIGHTRSGRVTLKCHWADCAYKAKERRYHIASHVATHIHGLMFKCEHCLSDFSVVSARNKHQRICRDSIPGIE